MKHLTYITLLTTTLLSAGCQHSMPTDWHAEHLHTIDGFEVPESVAIDSRTGDQYVSNIVTDAEAYWANDGSGHITSLDTLDPPAVSKLVTSTASQPLNAPKGLAILGDALWVADNQNLHRYELTPPHRRKTIAIPGAGRLNDVAAHDGAVYVSDTQAGRIYRIDQKHQVTRLPAPAGVNGLTFIGDQLYAVSWTEHEIYRVHPDAESPVEPLGLAEHFKNLDGIVALNARCVLVSDFTANRVHLVDLEQNSVRTLIELTSPADMVYDASDSRLYIPQFLEDRVAVYRLEPR